MAEKIDSGIYRIKVPLPGLELGYLNSYLIKSEGGCCLIDLGPKKENSLKKIKKELETNPCNINEILFTHFHPDHIGMFNKFRKSSDVKPEVRISSEETRFMKRYLENFDSLWTEQLDFANLNGVPEEITQTIGEVKPNPEEENAYSDIIRLNKPLKDGGEIRIGEHSIRAIKTPGHSPGHVCYYDSKKKLLFVGDHLLKETTPSVVQIKKDENPLNDYLESLDKIKDLEVDKILPGHGEPYRNHNSRVKELIQHHEKRLLEVKSIIGEGKLSPYEIAKKVDWDVDLPNWEDFPLFQKWMATGETLAHLSLLEGRNEVIREKTNGTNRYSLN